MILVCFLEFKIRLKVKSVKYFMLQVGKLINYVNQSLVRQWENNINQALSKKKKRKKKTS